MSEAYWGFRKTLKQAAPFLLLAGLGELLAGLLLKNYLNFIELAPGILVLLPALMNLKGAVQSALASRLGSAYHLGLIKPKSGFKNETIRQNLFAAIALTLMASTASAFFAYFACIFFGLKHIPLLSFILIALTASVIGAVTLSLTTVFLTIHSIKKKLDPDNVTIPSLTTIGDIFMVLLVYVIMVLFVGVIK